MPILKFRKLLMKVFFIFGFCWLGLLLLDNKGQDKSVLYRDDVLHIDRDNFGNESGNAGGLYRVSPTNKTRESLLPNTSISSGLFTVMKHAPSEQFLNNTSVLSNAEPVLVAMVTYQRSGSSFLGEIFNQNHEAFEWFEPLDGLYSAMYGTQYGHNVPADIWNHWDGTKRELPDFEIEALARVMRDILTCDFQDLPTEVLFHPFIGMFISAHHKMVPYLQCAKKKGSIFNSGRTLTSCMSCNLRLSKVCGKRFGQKPQHQAACSLALLPHLFPNEVWMKEAQIVLPANKGDMEKMNAVDKYRSCMKACRQRALSCVPHLQEACESASIRAVKPVRFPMKAAENLLNVLPQTKIIQNLRDPRGVVASRKNTSASFQAAYAGALLKPANKRHNIIREATLFCRNALSDVQTFNRMKAKSPSSSIQVIYEKYAQRPKHTARKIYNFLGMPLPKQVSLWLDKNTTNGTSALQTTRNSTSTSTRWHHMIKPTDISKINTVCSQFFDIMDHVWK